MSESVQPSLLEQLRQRVQQDFAPAPMSTSERLASFGRGVLSNRGSFLDNLSAGLASQQQAEAARREEGRKAAEIQAAMLERDRRAQLEKAKFAEETNPESLQGRERLARIRSLEAQAGAANRPSYREFVDQATGDVVLFNERTGQLMPQAGMRPVRSDVANITAQNRNRALAERAANEDVRTLQKEIDNMRAVVPRGGMEAYREQRLQFHLNRMLNQPGGEPPAPTQGPTITDLGRLGGR
jgi:hypothetical protein